MAPNGNTRWPHTALLTRSTSGPERQYRWPPKAQILNQVLIGRAIEEERAGAMLPSSSAPAEIRTVIERVLADDSCRREAQRLGKAIRATQGTETAAQLLQSLMSPTPSR